MTPNITPFPNNSEHYYQKAMQELQQKNYELAIDYLFKSYQIEPEFQTFEELVRLLSSLNDPKRLRKIWELSLYTIDDICHSSRISKLYAMSAPVFDISKQALLNLYSLKEFQTDSKICFAISQAIKAINDKLSFVNQVLNLHNSDEIQCYINTLNKKSNLDILTQLKTLYTQELEYTEPFLKAILIQDNFLNFIKSDILHYLIREKHNRLITLRWFKEAHTVNPADLVSYDKNPFYLENLSIIEHKMTKENPHLLVETCQLFSLYTMVTFPFLERGLLSANVWLHWIFQPQQQEEIKMKYPSIYRYLALTSHELHKIYQ